MTDRKSLTAIASGARRFLEIVWPEWQLESHRMRGSALPKIPSFSTCGRSSTFVQRVLEDFGIAANVQHGWFGPDGDGLPNRHAWVVSGSWLVDVTADQFEAAEIIVTDGSDARYRSDIDVALPEARLRRVQIVAEIWERWLRSPIRDRLLLDLNRAG